MNETLLANEPYDPAKCDKMIKDANRIPCDGLGLPYHCDTLTGVDGDYHDACVQAGIIYFQVPVADCWNTVTNANVYFSPENFFAGCGALYQQDHNWQQRWCYCCCACFARDTLIAVPGGVAEIYTIPVGADILSGSLKQDGVHATWEATKVKFSMGTGIGHQPMMIYIGFNQEGIKDLICTQDQPFLLASGKFTTGAKLRPGDNLVDKDGKPVDIHLVSMGSYDGGVHHLSTAKAWNGTPDGHLILAGGVVAGDFEFQLKFDSMHDSLKADDHRSLPSIGTAAYDNAAHNLVKSPVHFAFNRVMAAGPQAGQKTVTNGLFKTYRRQVNNMPLGAQPLLQEAQALDILKNGKQTSLADPTGRLFYESAMKQLTGFFPDIHFYLDEFDIVPNAYAFEAYGQKMVQVSGGLVRLINFNYEGIAMVLGHCIGSFYGGNPTVAAGYSAVGQADRYGFGFVSSKLWQGNPAFGYINAAIEQWTMLFNLVDPANAGGNPLDPLNDPSLACRQQIIQSAPFGGGLPECAGGPPKKLIALQEALPEGLEKLTLTFNLALDATTANNAANYTIAPEAKVLKAARSSQKDFVVELAVELEAGKDYTITAKNLKSALGTGMDPAHSSAEFKTGEV